MFLFIATSAHADGVFLDGGLGFFRSGYSQAVFLSYQKDSRPLFGLESFYSASIGSWNGEDRNSAIALAKGFLVNLPGGSYLCLEPGGAYVTETTYNLGTHFQFVFRSTLGTRIEHIDLSVGYRHFSNGKGIFRWTRTENHGENFITFQIGYLL